jgi:hypothetical protein
MHQRARPDLRGGRGVTRVPTATAADGSSPWHEDEAQSFVLLSESVAAVN